MKINTKNYAASWKAQRLELDALQDQEKASIQRVTAFRKIVESGKELTEVDPDVFNVVLLTRAEANISLQEDDKELS